MLYDLPDWKDNAMGHTEAALGAASRIQPGQTTTTTPLKSIGGAINAGIMGGVIGTMAIPIPGLGTAIGAVKGIIDYYG